MSDFENRQPSRDGDAVPGVVWIENIDKGDMRAIRTEDVVTQYLEQSDPDPQEVDDEPKPRKRLTKRGTAAVIAMSAVVVGSPVVAHVATEGVSLAIRDKVNVFQENNDLTDWGMYAEDFIKTISNAMPGRDQ